MGLEYRFNRAFLLFCTNPHPPSNSNILNLTRITVIWMLPSWLSSTAGGYFHLRLSISFENAHLQFQEVACPRLPLASRSSLLRPN